MSDQKESFGRTAEKLSRNPLGIIALFIVLAHAFASLILAFSNRLQGSQQWPLIIFVVLFPVVVLSIFTYLVIKHHSKLYAPADFRSDESFLKSVPPQEIRFDNVAKIESNIVEISGSNGSNGTIGSDDSKTQITPPIEPIVTNDVENSNNGSQDSKHGTKLSISDHFLAEDLALRKIEASFNEPVRRQSVVTAVVGGDIKFDGIILQDDLVTGIAVLLSKDSNSVMDRVYNRILDARNANHHLISIGRKFLFVLVLVIDDDTTRRYESARALKRKVVDRIKSKYPLQDMHIQVQVLNFESLKEEFSIT